MGVHFEKGGTSGRIFERAKVGGHYRNKTENRKFNSKIWFLFFIFVG